ncbi:MFS transporter [Kribbella sp. NPDC051587]|uniref:MFS transporter n=1 Tax=Kribbella sp. NPDC051587 TaxID=3364119 RepID=UPI00379FDFA4
MLLTIIVAAFETYAVVTIAPLVAADLDALRWYTWIFSAALLPQVACTVFFARMVDRRGLAQAHVAGLVLTTAGLAIAAWAPTMALLIAGRAIQGIGLGAIVNTAYASITLVLPDALHARAFSLLAGAYVVPAIVGPLITGVLADAFGWRSVFLALILAVCVIPLLTIKPLRAVRKPEVGAALGASLWHTSGLSVGLATATWGLSNLGKPYGIALAVVGAALVLAMVTKTLPGVIRFRSGKPAALLARGLTMAVFVGMEAILTYALTSRHHLSVTAVGFAISTSAVTWTAASWLSSRWDDRSGGANRGRRVLVGATIVLVAESAILLIPVVESATTAFLIAICGHAIAGFGIGMVEPTTGVIIMSTASSGSAGATAFEMQLVDLIAPALTVALVGAAIATVGSGREGAAVEIAVSLQLLVALISAIGASRIRQPAAS